MPPPTRRRVPALVTGFAVLALLGACGDEKADAPEPGVQADAPAPEADASEGEPHREEIDPAVTERVRTRTLAARDEPLAVGAKAPAFDELPAGKPAIVVFYRGHW